MRLIFTFALVVSALALSLSPALAGPLDPGATIKDCPECPELVVVPAGSFIMGSPRDEDPWNDNERPRHRVTIPQSIAVGRFEVTRGEWAAFVRATGRASQASCRTFENSKWEDSAGRSWRDPGFPQTDRDPVVCVNWDDAKAYVSWLSRKTGKGYRLLSEAEWEYVARAGARGRFSWGDRASHQRANYGKDRCCGGLASGRDRWVYTSPVGSFAANAFGLYDFHGNVREWVADSYNGHYKGAPRDGTVWLRNEWSYRVLRGGSWNVHPRLLRAASRDWNTSSVRDYDNGLRVARPAPVAPAEVAKKAAPLSPPPAPRPVEREAAVAPKRSLAELREAAAAGEAEGQYQLGRAYLTGAGVKTDPIEAVAWFILAAARGHALARDERDRHLTAEPNDRIAAAYRARALGPIIPAGWSEDPDSGTAVWLPSWYRNGVFKLELDVPAADGLAEGEGKAVLTAGLQGYFTDRTFEGHFSRGYFFGEQVMVLPFEMLPTDAYLVRLPDSGTGAFQGTAFWVHNRFRVAVAIHLCDQRSRLLAVVPDGFKVLDDAAVNAVIGEAARIYAGLCPTSEFAHVTVLPAAHQRVIDRRSTVFEPKLAEASVDGVDTQAFKILHFENHAAIAHQQEVRKQEWLSKIEAMRQKRQRNKAAAEARGMPDVRGLRLGMTLQQVRTLFADEIAEWKPPWDPKRKLHPYAQFSQAIRLTDGAKFNARFTSPVNGSKLFSFGYEQTLRNGRSVDSLTADLIAKYGEPDKVNWRGNVWTYFLVSQRPERVADGAFMRLSYLPHSSKGSAAVTYFSIGINDYGLGGGDESDSYQARLAAESAARKAQQAKEKSDKVKF